MAIQVVKNVAKTGEKLFIEDPVQHGQETNQVKQNARVQRKHCNYNLFQGKKKRCDDMCYSKEYAEICVISGRIVIDMIIT